MKKGEKANKNLLFSVQKSLQNKLFFVKIML